MSNTLPSRSHNRDPCAGDRGRDPTLSAAMHGERVHGIVGVLVQPRLDHEAMPPPLTRRR